MKEYLGWVGDSKMAATYVHLSGRNALFKLNGIKTEDEVNEEERLFETCLLTLELLLVFIPGLI
jgi:hypothetical protein